MRDRIKELRRVPASELLANRKNWRRHPQNQRAALRAIVTEVGFATAVVAYETPNGLVLIDGHVRVEEALPEELIPTLLLDVDDSEADKLLAVMDTIGSLAEPDQDALSELLMTVEFAEADLRQLTADLAVINAAQGESVVQGEREPELAIRAHEHYDYIVVLARTTQEWNNLCDRLNIGGATFDKGKGRKKIGVGRAILAENLIERLCRE